MSLIAFHKLLAEQQLELVHLNDTYDLTEFVTHADADQLGSWLRTKGLAMDSEDSCRVWLLVPENGSQPLGYFTLSAHQVVRKDIVRKDRYYDPKNGGALGAFERHPASLLGKFALSSAVAGTPRMGSLLMYCAFAKFLFTNKHTAARYLVLHTQAERLSRYYRDRYGFQPVIHRDEGQPFMLYKTSQAIREALSELEMPDF